MKKVTVLVLTFLSCFSCAPIDEIISELPSLNEDLTTAVKENILKEEELPSSDSKRNIFSIIFGENVLIHADTDFLIRLFNTEMQGKEILPGRKKEIETVLSEKIEKIEDFEAILSVLSYVYINQYKHALNLIIESLADDKFKTVMNYIKYLDFDFYEHLKSCKSKLKKSSNSDSDSEYEIVDYSDWKKEDRPNISLEVFKSLSVEYRLPAYIRYITNIPVSNDQVVSRFIKDKVLSNLDLAKIFVLYEIEMMDILHSHDIEAVIESHLKTKMFSESNENMADLAFKLFNEGHEKALKLVIDQKFSYSWQISNIFQFKDLFWLLNYSKDKKFPEVFHQKVLSLASPSVVRKYVVKSKNQKIVAKKLIEYVDEDFEELEFTK